MKVLAISFIGLYLLAGCERAPTADTKVTPEPKLRTGVSEEWRKPSKAERDAAVLQHKAYWDGRFEPPDHLVRADFDGDGRQDEAAYRLRGDQFALFVTRASGGEPIQLGSAEAKTELWQASLSIVPEGEHLTACGKGMGSRDELCHPTVRSVVPGIFNSLSESGGPVYFWNMTRFEEVWLTD